ncbi:sulfite exporter TauE/SafE family protein [Roseibium litorale]|uniref:Probable membrane transporter protein n=1 Tax=Roseibium litorale TaxID=2803841 RepID=A0ABR9CS58_9HYPH|nr:sulfite exporter TauE/SafE family protein [Roseibium litorale]MBD8893716.1 sulfite exporter TauE/SafE family protein [Roseibium litorale]
MFDIYTSFEPGVLLLLCSVLLIAGCVRGFAGFGAGMIYMPVATSLIFPPTAAASFLILDFVVAMPLVVRALRICDWSTIIPAVIASVLFVHAGTWLLATMDTLLLRWIIFGIVAAVLVLLISGWRYRNRPSPPISFGVGMVAGVLGGVSQVAGPPVVAFWLSSAKEPMVVRANLIVFFALASVGTVFAYWLKGFFNLPVLHLAIAGTPLYAIGLFLGSKGFGKADPKFYRLIAYSLIALAALSSMPLLDPLFGR